ncbi:MAG: DRTGG domain-containing protein [Alkalispirochaeta sp.]|jgi:predicted transcriptional regulator
MTLDECARRVSAEWIVPGNPESTFDNIVVSDLMSDVLVTEHDDFLLVTSLTSEQVVRTADIVEARAILLTNGKDPQPALRTLAEAQGMPILSSPFPTFDVCRLLAGCENNPETTRKVD